MGAAAIREKLQDYIKKADDKKVKAIYTMVEDDIISLEWWKDEKLLAAFEKETNDFETGKEKGFTLEEVRLHFKNKGKK
jgi:hypothetical protein